ncbi:hypothetical protein ES708_34711 [subsurface metagenome]
MEGPVVAVDALSVVSGHDHGSPGKLPQDAQGNRGEILHLVEKQAADIPDLPILPVTFKVLIELEPAVVLGVHMSRFHLLHQAPADLPHRLPLLPRKSPPHAGTRYNLPDVFLLGDRACKEEVLDLADQLLRGEE